MRSILGTRKYLLMMNWYKKVKQELYRVQEDKE